MTAEERIAKFLGEYPDGTLYVAVGYASIWGLDWLNTRTQGRRVKLLIGNAQYRYFNKASGKERAGALAFLGRDDVTLRNWYKKHGGKSDAHLKGWLISTEQGDHLLTGSANLTRQGLQDNHELMVEANGDDLKRAAAKMRNLLGESWDCRLRLQGYIEQQPGPQRNAHTSAQQTPGAAKKKKPNFLKEVIAEAIDIMTGPSDNTGKGRTNRKRRRR